MREIGRALGTVFVWAGVLGILHFMHYANHWDSDAAVWLVVGGFALTGTIWGLR